MTTGFKSIPIDIARVDLTKVCQTLVEHRVTRMPMPPSLLRLLLRLMAEVRDDLCLKTVVASGEALLRSDVGLFYEVMGDRAVLWQNYGSTETGPIAAGKYTAKDAERQGPLPLRRVHLGGQLEVVDSHGKVVPDGESGEFRVRSNFLANGYMNAPPEQMAKFGMDDRGRFFNIGDRGHRTLQGEYFIGAVTADQTAGDASKQRRVGHHDAPRGGSRVVQTSGSTDLLIAVLQAMPGADVTPQAVARDAPPAAIPRKFRVVDQMPRTTTGKLDLGAVAKLAAQSAEVASIGHGGPPLGTTENWIADTWQYILRIERPGREDRFQDVGGDSLAAIDLSLALEKRFGISVGLDGIAESRRSRDSPRSCSVRCRSRAAAVARDGHGPVCIMIPGIGGHAWVFAELARALHQPCDVLGSACATLSPGRNLDAVRQEVGCKMRGIARSWRIRSADDRGSRVAHRPGVGRGTRAAHRSFAGQFSTQPITASIAAEHGPAVQGQGVRQWEWKRACTIGRGGADRAHRGRRHPRTQELLHGWVGRAAEHRDRVDRERADGTQARRCQPVFKRDAATLKRTAVRHLEVIRARGGHRSVDGRAVAVPVTGDDIVIHHGGVPQLPVLPCVFAALSRIVAHNFLNAQCQRP
jgi:hypothetical protein